MDENVKIILKGYRLSVTRARLVMLEFFLQNKDALTHRHFLANTLLQLDRTTIFRTLNLFVEKKILLRFPAADGVNRYLLLQTKATMHANFICEGCKRIVPLEMIVAPRVKLPKGFRRQNMELIVSGLCGSCRN
jgi:Fur family ferric uptake transcriptional regulator